MSINMMTKVFVNDDSLNDESDHLEVEEENEINDNEEEEEETRINSNGSVLMPSDSPYDKFIKIKEANTELFSTVITKPKCPCKVQFNPTTITHSIEYDDVTEETILTETDEDPVVLVDEVDLDTSTESSSSDYSNNTVICKPSKLLLVTVPTVFTEQLDDEAGESIDIVDYDDDEEQVVDAELTEEIEETDAKDITDQLCNNSIEQHEFDEENEDKVDECVVAEEVDEDETENEDKDENEEQEDVEEDIEVIEDLTDDYNIQRSSSQNHKPVLTKNARIEEDSESESEQTDQTTSTYNNEDFHKKSIDNLIENFKEFEISSQHNEINKFKEEKINSNKSSTENDETILKQIKTNLENKSNIEVNKEKNSYKKSITLTNNIRSQCPIYQRNYGLQSSMAKERRTKSVESRPHTAPTRRHCCNYWDQGKLPDYNGLRSEYGLTAEQLLERKRNKLELAKSIRIEKEQKYMEEIRKQKENDLIFNSWLVRKKKEAAQKFSRKKLQSTFQFRSMPAPTKHLDKVGALRKKLLKKEQMSYSLEEFFKNANPHEQKTYRIYLGLCIE